MAGLNETFDLIFMEIDKEGYLPARPHCLRLLRVGGLPVTDNVGFQGSVAFSQEVFSHPRWRSVQLLSFLPGHSPEEDGLCLALRLK